MHWKNKGDFFAITAQVMRRILVDHARAHQAEKRGGGGVRIPIEDVLAMSNYWPDKFLALDESLRRLAELNSRQEQIVELRVFAGMSVEEIAELLKISPATVKRDWTMAKAWLSLEIGNKTLTVTPQPWAHIKEIFASAVELEADARPAFLRNACGPDQALLAEPRGAHRKPRSKCYSSVGRSGCPCLKGLPVDGTAGESVLFAFCTASAPGEWVTSTWRSCADDAFNQRVAIKLVRPAFSRKTSSIAFAMSGRSRRPGSSHRTSWRVRSRRRARSLTRRR